MLAAFSLLALAPANPHLAAAQGASRTFPETGHTVSGRFLEYWNTHGELAQQGYPISETMQEKSDTDGKVYTVQYFERAVFEAHPENQPPNDVLLSLLGVFFYNQRYDGKPPVQLANSDPDSRLFPETGKHVGGLFLTYWLTHGSVEQIGFPISEEFPEVSALDGHAYKVQYFQRGEMEFHPENQPPYNVLMSQLGTLRFKARYPNGVPTAGPTPTPPPPPTATPVPPPPPPPTATATPGPVYKVKVWVSDPNPHAGETVTVYGKITKDGAPDVSVLMQAEWDLRGGITTCKAYTGKDGVAACSRNIGPYPGHHVDIYVTFFVAPGVPLTTATSLTTR